MKRMDNYLTAMKRINNYLRSTLKRMVIIVKKINRSPVLCTMAVKDKSTSKFIAILGGVCVCIVSAFLPCRTIKTVSVSRNSTITITRNGDTCRLASFTSFYWSQFTDIASNIHTTRTLAIAKAVGVCLPVDVLSDHNMATRSRAGVSRYQGGDYHGVQHATARGRAGSRLHIIMTQPRALLWKCFQRLHIPA